MGCLLSVCPSAWGWNHRASSFELGFVADLDKASKVADSTTPLFQSYLQKAVLHRKLVDDKVEYTVSWKDVAPFTTSLNEAGRGFELSELAWCRGDLHTFDDRTGLVFRLEKFQLSDQPHDIRAVPVTIVTEGDGSTTKGKKHEWATAKDGELYMGSTGKEFITGNDVDNTHNMWVSILSKDGVLRFEDWTDNFAKVREFVGCGYPGYLIHEAIEWSAVHRKWFILPRRVSKDAYDETADEQRGSNVMIVASEDFSRLEVRTVGPITPERGFSSFKFVPSTQDSVIVALKSVEIEATKSQSSYVTVFTVDGDVLLPETPLPGTFKYEGVAFLREY
ncbi:hypothetical protein H257_14030 [Aphanomyces astaci]|uniref:Soluble calcium-activated nucleotidase 1 n=1 Tax=Aphanomyces astaci TaxID=112090 RepID=W4FU35_APHAT|nr:hypothetical protein H257_14030 [Aphanomyces astaci]ETV70339.1 hypothetical protein H257_14030 [Aphanomyces astaci]RQM28400.1 hypothetical protein B5M09_007603 [Aphanomyces astaci]|eukprot:XP_009840051.1 hypothetical protein H257_14030 [Aphanomyces astaci]